MKPWMKRSLFAIAPQWTTEAMSARSRAHSHKVVASWGCGQLNKKLIERFGNQVQRGPFAGLTLSPITHAEQLGPYLLGSYENELDPAWETIFLASYPQIIDVGAKFGYYAVGLAKRYPKAAVIAFDTDWWARKALREMIKANQVSNVEVQRFCSPEWLHRNLRESSLVISDCEGYEAVLFDSSLAPHLLSATIIIETHDNFVPGVCDRIRSVFEKTHTVKVIGDSSEPKGESHPLDFLGESDRRLALQEFRSPQHWLFCLPKSRSSQVS